MALISDLTNCGVQTPPGTEVDLYYTCTCEMADWPAITAGTTLGNKFKLSEPFDFTGAASGTGYWRKARLLVDTGAYKAMIEGEVGGQSTKSEIRGFLIGSDAERMEIMDNFRMNSGCLAFIIKGREQALSAVIGSKTLPASVTSAEMDSGEKAGDRNGTAYVFSAPGPIFYYDAATHGIDVTPNS